MQIWSFAGLGLKIVGALWWFVLDAVVGKRVTLTQAYRTNPKQLLVAVFFILLFLSLSASCYRLFILSKRIIELESSVQTAEVRYRKLEKEHQRVLSGNNANVVATPSVTQPPTHTPGPLNRHQEITNDLRKIDIHN